MNSCGQWWTLHTHSTNNKGNRKREKIKSLLAHAYHIIRKQKRQSPVDVDMEKWVCEVSRVGSRAHSSVESGTA